jgi:hypothetical protein
MKAAVSRMTAPRVAGLFGGALVLLAALALVPLGSSTTAPSIYITVHVTLTDSKVIMSPKSAPRGSDARFLIRNVGTRPHAFTIGETIRGTGLQTGFSRVFKPSKKTTILFLYLDYRGTIPYFGGDSAAKATREEKGVFTIGAQCSLCIQDD